MADYFCEVENLGIIMTGRVVASEFESTDEIEELAAAVQALGEEHGVDLSLVYAGTTINWPDDFEWTPSLIGVVTHVDYGNDEAEGGEPLPRAALNAVEIPDAIWDTLAERGVELEESTGVFLACAGWTWTQIRDEEDNILVGVSTEDDAYVRLDEEVEGLFEGDGPLTMLTSYC